MQKALYTTLLLLSFRLLASETFLPEKLLCSSESKLMNLQQFTLTKINSGKPFLTSDLSWQKTEFSGPDLSFTFTSTDDEPVTFKFSKIDLYNLKLGSTPSITGQLLSPSLEQAESITCSEVK